MPSPSMIIKPTVPSTISDTTNRMASLILFVLPGFSNFSRMNYKYKKSAAVEQRMRTGFVFIVSSIPRLLSVKRYWQKVNYNWQKIRELVRFTANKMLSP